MIYNRNTTFIALIICFLFACGGVDEGKQVEQKTVRYKKEQINQNISVQESYEMIGAHAHDTMLVLLDIRSRDEFETGIIKNAITLEYKDPELKAKLDSMDKDKIYIVYCRTGGRSGITLGYMKKMGFREAYNMKGGIEEWREKGFGIAGYN